MLAVILFLLGSCLAALPQGEQASKVWNHPFYQEPFFLAPILGRDFVSDVDPRTINTVHQADPKELARQMAPLAAGVPYDAEQIVRFAKHDMGNDFVDVVNMNSDLGLQYTLRTLLRTNVLVTHNKQDGEHPAYVILSHGHSIAGLAELAKMTTRDKAGVTRFLFDTSVFLPMGGWSTNMELAALMGSAAQIWGDEIEKTRNSYRARNMLTAGGIAIALNGHRGDPDYSIEGPNDNANIDCVKMLGTPEKFIMELAKRRISRVVIIVEHLVKNPNKANVLPLDALKRGKHPSLNRANQDLYQYMAILKKKGVDVIVVSGEQRTSLNGV